MRYAYSDLGEQTAGTTAVVRWRGSPANVVLLDPVNFAKYHEGRTPVFYSGGGHGRSPARLSIPQDGRWYVVADFGGTSIEATVEILKPRGGKPPATEEKSLVEVG
jgi:uncharacterized protein DUF1883